MINFAKYERMVLETQIDAGRAYLGAVGIGMLFTGYDVSQLRIRVDADGTVIPEWQPLNRHPVHYLRGCEWAIEQRVDFETAVNVVEFVATLPQTYGILREDDNPDLIEVFVPHHADLEEVKRVWRAVVNYRRAVIAAFAPNGIVTPAQLYAMISPI